MTAALIENGRNLKPSDVRLVQDGRILLGAYGITAPTGPNWDPSSDLAGEVRKDLGYYGDTGFSLTPEPGENKQFRAHNEDVVIDEDGPGTWAVAFSGIQRSRELVQAYFDAIVDPTTGQMTLTKASVNTYRDLVTVGISGDDVIISHYPRVKVASREALQFGATAINAYGLTFRAYRDPVAGYIVRQWDTSLISEAAVIATVTDAVPATGQAPAGNVVIIGTDFGGATAVTFGGVPATSFTINSATQITAIMPEGTVGVGEADIVVTNSGGSSSAFEYDRL